MNSQLAVIMFADVVGYSAMMEADQDKTINQIRALRHAHLEPTALEHGGRVLKRLGDGWIIAFKSISACIDCAMDVQNKLQAAPDVRLRIGCHFGDITEEDDDVYGGGLNIAERIQAEAPPGGLMISEDMARQLSGMRSEAIKDAGVFQLKNIAQPVRLFQWRPVQQVIATPEEATSIAIGGIDYAPEDADTRAIAGDLREQLFVRMSRRAGIVVYDAVSKPVDAATYDLRSRVRISGGRGRFSVTLVSRADGRPVWSESYDRDTRDIFDFCDVVLEQAEADLRLQTNAFDGDRLAHIPDEELSISELRSRAANLYYRMSYEDWVHGLALMKRAVAMNPSDGVALSMRAEGEIMLHAARYETMSDALLAELERQLDTAIEQKPGSDYVYWARGTFRINCRGDIEGARSDLSRSRQLNPAYMEAHELDGHVAMLEGNYSTAADCFDRLIERQTHNPLLPYRQYLRAVALYCGKRFEEAAEQARLSADARPRDRMLLVFVSLASEAAGDTVAASNSRGRLKELPLAPSICARCPILPPEQVALYEKLSQAYRGGPL